MQAPLPCTGRRHVLTVLLVPACRMEVLPTVMKQELMCRVLSRPPKQGHQATAIDHPDSVKKHREESDQGGSGCVAPENETPGLSLSKMHVIISKPKVTTLWGHLLRGTPYAVSTQTSTHPSDLACHGHVTIFLKSPPSEFSIQM